MPTRRTAVLALLLALHAPAVAASSGHGTKGPVLPTLTAPVTLPPSALPAGIAYHAAAPLAAGVLPSPVERVAPLREGVRRQIQAMGEVLRPGDQALLASISATADGVLDGLEASLAAGGLEEEAEGSVERVGFFPVAADPPHWGHLFIGLDAVARLRLDRVVFVPAGDDERKPTMTPAVLRHPVVQATLAPFSPFLQYSPLALGTTLDGETNLFRYLAANAARRLVAYYLVGDDHYRRLDARGRPDTIAKIEANFMNPDLAFRPDLHRVSLAFIEREGRAAEPVPTALEVRFLPRMPFEASSTHIRHGALALMPYDAYRFVRDEKTGLYGISGTP